MTIELVDPTKHETFTVPQGAPNERRRRELAWIKETRQKETLKLNSEFKDVVDLYHGSAEQRIKAVSDNPELAERALDYGRRLDMIQSEAVRSSAKASLDTRELAPDRRAMIESNIDSDFWLEQDLPALEEAGETFSASYTDRRLRGRTLPGLANGRAAIAGQDAPSGEVSAAESGMAGEPATGV